MATNIHIRSSHTGPIARTGKSSIKIIKKPAPARKRRIRRHRSPLTPSLSDEEGGYSGLENVSDSSDNDSDDVDAIEEEHIVKAASASTPVNVSSLWIPSELDLPSEADALILQESIERDDDDEFILHVPGSSPMVRDLDDSISWHGFASESVVEDFESPRINGERKVHFAVPITSDSDSTDTDDDDDGDDDDDDDGEGDAFFPDIFVDQNSLDPTFRREIELESDDSTYSATYWDYNGTFDFSDAEGEEEGTTVLADAQSLSAPASPTTVSSLDAATSDVELAKTSTTLQESDEYREDSDDELDGYDSDGDTTDEDEEPEPFVRRKSARSTPDATNDVNANNSLSQVASLPTAKPVKGQPRSGHFALDESDDKPIAVINPVSRKMMIFTPSRVKSDTDASFTEQFNLDIFEGFDDLTLPSIAPDATTYLSTIDPSQFLAALSEMPGVPPPEQLYPFVESTGEEESYDSDMADVEDDEEGTASDEAEQMLDINDFIQWNAGSDESEDEEEEEGGGAMSTPKAKKALSGMEEASSHVLSHLTPQTVAAFRRNQIDQQLIFSSQATEDSLAFSGPYNHTAIRGIKSDRVGAAGVVPLTPLRRRRKRSQDHSSSLMDSPNPSGGPSRITKRRSATVSETAYAVHRRQRSMPDVALLSMGI